MGKLTQNGLTKQRQYDFGWIFNRSLILRRSSPSIKKWQKWQFKCLTQFEPIFIFFTPCKPQETLWWGREKGNIGSKQVIRHYVLIGVRLRRVWFRWTVITARYFLHYSFDWWAKQRFLVFSKIFFACST